MIGPLKLMGKGIFLFFSLVLKYWWITLTLFLVLSGLVASINESVEQKDAKIVLRFLGTSLLSADEGIYEVVQDLEFETPKREGLVEKLTYYAEFAWFLAKALWRHLWMLIFWFMFFFKLGRFLMSNDSKSLRAFVITIFLMSGLQMLMGGIPFRGLYFLVKFIIGVIASV